MSLEAARDELIEEFRETVRAMASIHKKQIDKQMQLGWYATGLAQAVGVIEKYINNGSGRE